MIAGIIGLLFSAAQTPPEWKEPIEPFRIIGSIHYVGTAELASYLITTDEGHILLDTPCEEETPLVLESVRKLGFDPKDIKILLNSQAHYDHTGGLRAIEELSGARMMAGARDAELLARGGRGDFAFGDRFLFPEVSVDRTLEDGDEIVLGAVSPRWRGSRPDTPAARRPTSPPSRKTGGAIRWCSREASP